MHVQLWQMLLIIAYGFFINYDKNGTMIGTSQPVTAGLIVGLIMGDLKTGLYIGATLQLMTLGISSFGGASVPDYQTAALVGQLYCNFDKAGCFYRNHTGNPGCYVNGSVGCAEMVYQYLFPE